MDERGCFAVVGAIAAILTILAFITGKQWIGDYFTSEPVVIPVAPNTGPVERAKTTDAPPPPAAPVRKAVPKPAPPAAATVEKGSFKLGWGEGYSFALERVVKGQTDVVLAGPNLLRGYAWMPLGPVRLDGVASLPKHAPSKSSSALSLFAPPSFPRQGEWIHGGLPAVYIDVGHVYALRTAESGPYALLQVQEFQRGGFETTRIEIAYRIQQSGGLGFH